MLKRVLRIALFPAICVLWAFGWICYSIGIRQARAKQDESYLSSSSMSTLRSFTISKSVHNSVEARALE
jgi:hypothetical protein